MAVNIDLPITCTICGIRHDGGPTGYGPCPKGHTMADEVAESNKTTRKKTKSRKPYRNGK